MKNDLNWYQKEAQDDYIEVITMDNEQLILDRLLKIQEDIGGMKEAQDNCDDRMISLEGSIKEVRKHCDDAFTLQLTRNQVILGGSIITAIATYFGLGGVQ